MEFGYKGEECDEFAFQSKDEFAFQSETPRKEGEFKGRRVDYDPAFRNQQYARKSEMASFSNKCNSVFDALDEYGALAFNDVARNSAGYKKQYCGMTFHPGLFRLSVVRRFLQLYSTYKSLDGIQEFVKHGIVDRHFTCLAWTEDLIKELKHPNSDLAMQMGQIASVVGVPFCWEQDYLAAELSGRLQYYQTKLEPVEGVWIKKMLRTTRHMNWNYVVRVLWQEAERLAVLEVSHREAFEERTKFYNFDVIRETLAPVFNEIDQMRTAYRLIEDRQVLRYKPGWFKPVDEAIQRVQEAVTYRELATAVKLLYDTRVFGLAVRHLDGQQVARPEAFVEAYIRTGLFYSLRSFIGFQQMVIFDGEPDQMAKLNSMVEAPAEELFGYYEKAVVRIGELSNHWVNYLEACIDNHSEMCRITEKEQGKGFVVWRGREEDVAGFEEEAIDYLTSNHDEGATTSENPMVAEIERLLSGQSNGSSVGSAKKLEPVITASVRTSTFRITYSWHGRTQVMELEAESEGNAMTQFFQRFAKTDAQLVDCEEA